MLLLKIIEWNIGLRTINLEKISKYLYQIEPDIIIFTEVKRNQMYNQIVPENFLEKNFPDYYFYGQLLEGKSENQNFNDIVIGVRNKRIITKCKEFELLTVNSRDYKPDLRGVSIEVSGKKIDILGVRFQNYNMTNQSLKNQRDSFFSEIEKFRDRENVVVIGDFNNGTSSVTGGWENFIKTMKNHSFLYKTINQGEHGFSYQKKGRNKIITSSPDNVFVKGLDIGNYYYFWGNNNYSDHAILVVELKIN